MGENGMVRLVERAQAGEREAFDRLLERSWDGAMRYTTTLVGPDTAPDAVQSAFVEAWRDLHSLRNPAAFSPWLRRILFKQCDRLRRSAPHAIIPIFDQPDATTPNPADILGASDEARRRNGIIRRAIRTLPPGEQVAVSLFYVGGCSHRDVAEYLGIRIPAVKSRLHSARSRLRERIQQMNDTTDGEQFFPDETVADLTEAERQEALHGIRECYLRYEDGYETQDPDIVLPTMTEDYLVIFPAEMNHPAWDKVRVEAEVRKCGIRERGGPRLKVLIDHLLSVERDPITGTIVQVTLRVTLLREGHKGDNSPFGRIDTLKRDGDTWRLRRTLGLGAEKS